MNITDPLVSLSSCLIRFQSSFELNITELNISKLQHTVVLGRNGSGKTALSAFLAGNGTLESGAADIIKQLRWVSIEQQQALIEAEKQKDCADIWDVIPEPTSVEEVLYEGIESSQLDQNLVLKVLKCFSLEPLLERPFRALSTGETKKLLIAKSIISEPSLMILDEPWDGLDNKTCIGLSELLLSISDKVTFLFVLNRVTEVPSYCQQLVLMDNAEIQWQAKVEKDSAGDLNNDVNSKLDELITQVKQLQHLQQVELRLPQTDSEIFGPRPLNSNDPLVKLTNAKVQYGDSVVFKDLDWTIQANQHWQVTGPNGSGKTCLLNLITGDHPQCYVNDIFVFGYQRGSGETIWQIKQYIGYMSNVLHLDYRVNCSVLHVVLSGFYDSIGLYKTPTTRQISLAHQWLSLMALEDQATTGFQQLSFGDQRLVLIARAMVKHPSLLILDEPCNGLDEINRLKVLALIDLLARQGTTSLLYVNHHQEDVIPSIKNHISMLDYNE
ncbi:ATP-binding cassette domain-containing protein [Paraglaciecola aquimarina]|uniref:ATP-binding cassette domain-containing protein n=1 Tax=Paraglaciecola algarum TaxID=3050085 RepID=A0ABS9D4M3_9ALTE|nr:ATP-binding cassette domain-containing protein [Paraglaciecola sp. G1-23]MCF2946973.1 ATP-binding cassette domain-containing protein [Paraglaciecola sp. G1-23]